MCEFQQVLCCPTIIPTHIVSNKTGKYQTPIATLHNYLFTWVNFNSPVGVQRRGMVTLVSLPAPSCRGHATVLFLCTLPTAFTAAPAQHGLHSTAITEAPAQQSLLSLPFTAFSPFSQPSRQLQHSTAFTRLQETTTFYNSITAQPLQ